MTCSDIFKLLFKFKNVFFFPRDSEVETGTSLGCFHPPTPPWKPGPQPGLGTGHLCSCRWSFPGAPSWDSAALVAAAPETSAFGALENHVKLTPKAKCTYCVSMYINVCWETRRNQRQSWNFGQGAVALKHTFQGKSIMSPNCSVHGD